MKTVSNTTPKAILDACAKLGINIKKLLSETNLNNDIIKKPASRTSFDDVIKLWEKSYEKTQNRMIGIKAADTLSFGAYKIIDYIFVSSLTPKDGLLKFSNYYPLVNDGFISLISVKGDFGYIEIHNPTDPKILPFQYIDFIFACILSRVRFSNDLIWNPIEVHLTCSEPENIVEYHQLFQCPVRFNQSINQIIIQKDLLETLQPNADSQLCEMLNNHAQKLLKKLPPKKDVLYELSRILRKNLPYGETDLNSSARKMGMSRRSLQRKLKSRGISYRELLNQVRYDLAKNLLTQENVSVEETAFLTGYSEKSAFYRAFKQWTGKTPQDFLNH